ncbi:hypothetical protein BST61_g4040 [Cercospora zeina]
MAHDQHRNHAGIVDGGGKNGLVHLQRFPHLHLTSNTPKGRGVVASAPIPAGTVIDVSPVLVLGIVENIEHIEQTQLFNYTYNWPTKNSIGEPRTAQAVVFGLGSMFNHSAEEQNVGWKRDLERRVIVYQALRDIPEGEELFKVKVKALAAICEKQLWLKHFRRATVYSVRWSSPEHLLGIPSSNQALLAPKQNFHDSRKQQSCGGFESHLECQIEAEPSS